MTDTSPLLIIILAFTAVTGIVFVVGQYITRELRIQQRMVGAATQRSAAPGPFDSVNALVAKYFDERRFKVEGPVRAKLRQDLLRAGFFHPNAINYYIFWRIAIVLFLPLIAYALTVVFMAQYGSWPKLGMVVLATMLAVLGPDAYLSRRQRVLTLEYRSAFPDLLDLIVVCIDAGLSLEAALDRISVEMVKKSRHLGINLLLMGSEVRAGRSTIDALDSLAVRLGLDEARAFVAMLRQSLELGSDVGDALRVFSEEMRDRRLIRAEELANQVPVKMVIPLGTCIFPVILLVVLLPVIIRFSKVFR